METMFGGNGWQNKKPTNGGNSARDKRKQLKRRYKPQNS